MTLRQQAREIIERSSDWDEAAEAIYNSGPDLSIYMIRLACIQVDSKKRHLVRKRFHRDVINPDFINKKPGKAVFTIVRSKKRQERILRATENLFANYMIGSICLGNTTKKELMESARHDRAGIKGTLRVAIFKERIAAPLKHDDSSPYDYWRSIHAIELIKKEIWEKTEEQHLALIAAE